MKETSKPRRRVLVTGATGFLGNAVITELLAGNCEIIATARSEDRARTCSWFGQVEFLPFDINEVHGDLFEYFGRPDKVIHLAWEGLPDFKATYHLERNLPANLAFLGNLVEHGLTDCTVTGTCLEYGLKEGCLREDMPAEPVTAYGMAKDSLRRALEDLRKQFHFTFRWIRLFYLYGPGQSPSSIVPQLERAVAEGREAFNMSGGEQLRDYLPLDAAARCIVRISLQNQVQGIINCCSGEPVSVRAFVERLVRERGYRIRLNLGYYPYPDYEPMEFWGDTRKLKLAMKATQ